MFLQLCFLLWGLTCTFQVLLTQLKVNDNLDELINKAASVEAMRLKCKFYKLNERSCFSNKTIKKFNQTSGSPVTNSRNILEEANTLRP